MRIKKIKKKKKTKDELVLAVTPNFIAINALQINNR